MRFTRQQYQGRASHRRGVALVLVVAMIAVAATLSLALLTSNTTQTVVGADARRSADADYLAESAVNVALYYLQTPTAWTGAAPDGYYAGESNLNLGAGAPGVASVNVAVDPTEQIYQVVGTGRVSDGNGGIITRTCSARIKPVGNFNVNQPLVVVGEVYLPAQSEVTAGDSGEAIRSGGAVHADSGAVIENGDVVAPQLIVTHSGTPTAVPNGTNLINVVNTSVAAPPPGAGKVASVGLEEEAPPSAEAESEPSPSSASAEAESEGASGPPSFVATSASPVAPPPSKIKDYRTYRWTNPITSTTATYSATKLTSATVTGTLGPTPTNPAGVYWADVDTTLQGTTEITGTLITIGGAAIHVDAGHHTFRPSEKFPAIASSGALRIGAGSALDANGLVYTNQMTTAGNGAGADWVIRGAMMIAGGSMPSDFVGRIRVIYDKSANVNNFSNVVTTPTSLSVVSWAQ